MGVTNTKVRDSIEAREPVRSPGQRLPMVALLSEHNYWDTVRRELAQHQLKACGPSAPAKSDDDGASVANVLRALVDDLQPLGGAIGCKIELELIDRGTVRALDNDLRAAIRALLESSLGQGSHQVRVVLRLDPSTDGQQIILIEVLSDALDVGDAVRRKLSKAVIAHAGETSFISAPTGSCVRIRIPKVALPKPANRRVSGEHEKALPRRAASSSHLPASPTAKSACAAPEISEYVPRL